MSIKLIQPMSELGQDQSTQVTDHRFSPGFILKGKQSDFYRSPSKMLISIKLNTIIMDIKINSSLSRHSCYQHFMFSCTKKNHFLPWFMHFLGCLFAFPCFTHFQEHLIAGRAEMSSPTSAISHSYLITRGSAETEGSRVLRKKRKNANNLFHSLWECVNLCLAQNSIWQEWITRVLKNSQEISKEIYSCLTRSHSLPSFLLTFAAYIDHL